MSMTDPIADLLARIRNAYLAKHDRLDVPISKLKTEVCQLLKREGYLEAVEVVEREPRRLLRIFLKYSEGEPVIRHIERVSKPGRRVYMRSDELRPVLNGLGVGIVSTPQGLLSDSEARERRVGGEVLCEVW
ncbi:MAG: 30S ribosomal protein S8 [Acidobacteriota bacterium]|nr:30S ribosomal protein S8 [Acidobacteriota bacterium]